MIVLKQSKNILKLFVLVFYLQLIEFSLESLYCNKELRGKRDKINYIFVKADDCIGCSSMTPKTNTYTITSANIKICNMID